MESLKQMTGSRFIKKSGLSFNEAQGFSLSLNHMKDLMPHFIGVSFAVFRSQYSIPLKMK